MIFRKRVIGNLLMTRQYPNRGNTADFTARASVRRTGGFVQVGSASSEVFTPSGSPHTIASCVGAFHCVA